MQIELKKSTECTINEWESYTRSFNQVFHKTKSVNDFKYKYFNTITGFSYHALLKTGDLVVGGCTIIPFEYLFNDSTICIGLAVDVFIVEDYRTDPLALYKMYTKLKKILILQDIALVIAVPNDTVYPYWKNIVKWKDVGYLKYYVLPLKIGNVVSKLPKFLNGFSILLTKILLACSSFLNFTEKESLIRINRLNRIVEKQRYTKHHKKIILDNSFFTYRIINEDGIITCYLIDFYNQQKQKKDSNTLRKAIKYIYTKENIDLIVFVGKLSFFQFMLFKIPFLTEPKHLYFMVDILNKNKLKYYKFVFDINNWDFGLFNYDVR